MKSRKSSLLVGAYAVACTVALLHFVRQSSVLKDEVARLRAEIKAAATKRPRMKIPPRPPRPHRPMPWENKPTKVEMAGRLDAPQPTMTEAAIDEAVKARIEARKRQAEEARERRREAIASMTPEQKEAQKNAFLDKMRERAQRRLKSFVKKTELNSEQTAAFENTVAAMDATLRETATAWAEQIRKTGTFARDAQVKFVGDVSAVISAGYSEMDATLPESWRNDDGNVNLMEIIGPEALSSVVDALTESGLEDGLQTIGQVMGGPDSDAGGELGGDMAGIESPGVGDGPGGAGGAKGGNTPPPAH